MRRKKKSSKRGPVVAKKVQEDGIQFASGLELYMYRALKKARLFDMYEDEEFELSPAFELPSEVYERQANGKGEFKMRSSRIRNVKYTPDFTGEDYIIETKGRANESFPIRYKLFKLWLFNNKDTRRLYKPQTKKECDVVIGLILLNRDAPMD